MEEPDTGNERGPNTLPYNKKKIWISTYQMEKKLDILLEEMAQMDNKNVNKLVEENIEGQVCVDQFKWTDEHDEEITDYEDLYENIYEDLPEQGETCQMNKTNKHTLYENWYEVFNNDMFDKSVTSASPSVDQLLFQLDELMESLTEVLDKLKDTLSEDSKTQTTTKGNSSMATDTLEIGVEKNVCHFRYSLDESLSNSWSYHQKNMNEQKAMNYVQTAGLLSTRYKSVLGLLGKTAEVNGNEDEKEGIEKTAANNYTEKKSKAVSIPRRMSTPRLLRKFSLRGDSDISMQTDKEPKEELKKYFGFEQMKTIVIDERKAESNNKAARVLGLSSLPHDVMKKLRKENGPTTEKDKAVDEPKTEPTSKAARVLGLQQLPYHANGFYMRVPTTASVEGSRHRSRFWQGKTKYRARSTSDTR